MENKEVKEPTKEQIEAIIKDLKFKRSHTSHKETQKVFTNSIKHLKTKLKMMLE
jgi:hypothetical protein